jgi:hypothetical protein
MIKLLIYLELDGIISRLMRICATGEKIMDLKKELPMIAARVLHNTHCFPKNLKDKYNLIALAYGRGAVVADFEAWCNEVKDKNPRYPITEYMKIVDSRLGTAFEEKRADTTDPRIPEITAMAYELTGVPPSARSVATLLLSFTPEEIKAALGEYAATLDDKDVRTGMRVFFLEGGAAAVILARQKRAQNGR